MWLSVWGPLSLRALKRILLALALRSQAIPCHMSRGSRAHMMTSSQLSQRPMRRQARTRARQAAAVVAAPALVAGAARVAAMTAAPEVRSYLGSLPIFLARPRPQLRRRL